MTQREALNWEPIREFWRNNSGVNWDELEAAIKEALAQQDVQDEIDRGAKTLRETYLAQPEQEPVGEVSKAEFGDYPVICWRKGYVAKIGDKFYTTPPQMLA